MSHDRCLRLAVAVVSVSENCTVCILSFFSCNLETCRHSLTYGTKYHESCINMSHMAHVLVSLNLYGRGRRTKSAWPIKKYLWKINQVEIDMLHFNSSKFMLTISLFLVSINTVTVCISANLYSVFLPSDLKLKKTKKKRHLTAQPKQS